MAGRWTTLRAGPATATERGGTVPRCVDCSQRADHVELVDAYAEPARRRVDGRPWLLVNMIASLDGAVALGERSGGLGGPADQRVFAHLREIADVIVVGAGTARAESYGPPRKAGQRIGVVTRRANLDWTSPLFTSGAGFVITAADAPDVPVDAVRPGTGRSTWPGLWASSRGRSRSARAGPR
jgi:hypothetical protein